MSLLKLFKKKQYIFSINTGRAGSEYLSEILATSKNVYSDHEPQPKMIGKYLDMVTDNNYENSYQLRKFKVQAIKKTLKKSHCLTYIETNHMFIKTFYDVVINELPNVKIVFLKRNLIDTLHSFYELGYFSERNQAWKEWMISPYAVTSAIPCLLNKDEKDEIELSIAYLIDIYARAYRFMKQYPEIPVLEINLIDLNNPEKVKKLFLDLNLELTEDTIKILGTKKNNRADRKKEIGSKVISKTYLKERTLIYLDRLKTEGIDMTNKLIIE